MAETVHGSTGPKARGGRPSKRAQIETAAGEVFGRVGFADATMDSIAAEAQVSTRTLYQHFRSKNDLFAAVLTASASLVAGDFARGAQHALHTDDVRSALVVLGHAFIDQRTSHPQHFAMVNQLKARAVALTPDQTTTWHDAGPYRVQTEVASVLHELGRRLWLGVPDVRQATLHFIALTTAESTIRPFGAEALTPSHVEPMVTAGVDAFLRAYGTDTLPTQPIS
ncbi:TetR/AcrR family transcriptional regulator [Rhodococcus sp. G-MC3]|uniref:TetR/AcrR family transcriptional regulator n=1 Tax=Rhodococcus sp. G-MC3 TaxID=3046209 RepID=UPI0024BB918C|nr:TetR/AcrR family transcriptional regulator [Rhodococcus sp. G-MC3]MDJ0396737.1 TetR/AcrR family transcriptional regulator [Rhodococcus sp. G-MC3]